MPLVRWYQNCRIKKTKRVRDHIRVKLAGRTPTMPPRWVCISFKRYQAHTRYLWIEPGNPIPNELPPIAIAKEDT